MLTIELLRRFWKPIALILFLIAYAAYWDHRGAHRITVERDNRDNIAAAAQARALVAAEEKARKQESDWNAAFAVINNIQMESLKDAMSRRDRIIAQLRAGSLRLPSDCGSVPQTAADSGQSATGSVGGQSELVAESITDRFEICDEVTLERNQAVRLLEAERK